MASVSRQVKIVQCHGCFDLLHIGHIRHFQAAKAAGDYLIVTVTPDRFVNKGPGRPMFTETLRMEAVKALACVDEVRLTDAQTAADAIRQIQPDVFAKGPDYSEALLDPGELQAIRDVGATLLITDTAKWSSTALLNRSSHSHEVDQYLASLRRRYTVADVLGWLEQARALKVLVIGETITDEYRFGGVVGMAGKEPIPIWRYERSDRFNGGAAAVVEHVKACCDDVSFLTGPPIVKRRFIHTYPFQKLFGEDEIHEPEQAKAGLGIDRDAIDAADLVVVADYGHGLVSSLLVDAISEKARMLAVNVQTNGSNRGFNTLSKYRRADFFSLSESELRLDARDEVTEVRTLMGRAAHARHAIAMITRGEKGCLVYDAENGFHEGSSEAPALATHIVDRVGAGDAVFGVTACCAAVGMPADLLAFMASVVGTQAVGIVGNAQYIERASLQKAIETWLA